MDADGKVARHAANAAFTAALALASGEYELARRLLDSMLRAHLLTRDPATMQRVRPVTDGGRGRG